MSAPTARTGAVVLAAGGSTRLGAPKQLLEYEGEPLVRRAARAALAAGAAPVLVVVGAHADRVGAALEGIAGVRVVEHAGWSDGLASSLAAGLRALLDEPVDAVLVTLCDQPHVGAAELASLVAECAPARPIVAAEYAGIAGVPIVVARTHVAELLTLSGDRGAGGWLRARAALVTRVPLPAAALDVDTPEDAARLSALRPA